MTNQLDLIAPEPTVLSIVEISKKSENLALIFKCPPPWVQIKSVEHNGVCFTTNIVRADGETCRPIECIAFEQRFNGTIFVKERSTNYLPAFCPERHINDDGTFCLGLRAGEFELTPDSIARWWDKLKVFLSLQETAHISGKWNSKAAMRHGKAADLQLIGEAISLQLGLEHEFNQALHFRKGILHYAKLCVRKKSGLLVNGRMECPCGRKNKRGRHLLRVECRKKALDCPAKLLAEIEVEEQAFWQSHKAKKCCGTMESCPLKDVQEHQTPIVTFTAPLSSPHP